MVNMTLGRPPWLHSLAYRMVQCNRSQLAFRAASCCNLLLCTARCYRWVAPGCAVCDGLTLRVAPSAWADGVWGDHGVCRCVPCPTRTLYGKRELLGSSSHAAPHLLYCAVVALGPCSPFGQLQLPRVTQYHTVLYHTIPRVIVGRCLLRS